jgi:hypothetical protein
MVENNIATVMLTGVIITTMLADDDSRIIFDQVSYYQVRRRVSILT